MKHRVVLKLFHGQGGFPQACPISCKGAHRKLFRGESLLLQETTGSGGLESVSVIAGKGGDAPQSACLTPCGLEAAESPINLTQTHLPCLQALMASVIPVT